MFLIYTHKITHRNKYIFNLIFKDTLGIDFVLTQELDEFKAHDGAKLSYTHNPIADELFFTSRNLLFETGITEQNISVFDLNDSKVFFATGKSSALPFDVFAASFYLVSRYEEYLPHIRDEHDRFDAKDSLAFTNGFLQKPLVNTWAIWIKELIVSKYPQLVFPEQKYHFVSTIDIDNAYAYREKGFTRSVGGYLKSLSKFDFKEVSERTRAILGLDKDPYDTYEFQLEIIKKYNLKSIYFFLLGDYGINDKNLPIESKKFQSLIKMLGDYAQIGIHPSYGSNKNKTQLKKEVERLSKVLHRDITQSRQHFLKLTLPETYRNLIDLDITDDYTMGFASQVGFRASICTPFNFYDLDMELETKLKIHPFAMMEGTLKYSMKVSPEDAMTKIKPLIDEVKKVDGVFMSLWHNDTLNDRKIWAGWKAVYEKMVQYAATK
ncbi:MAG TPA: polysaccharide deacetylase family protein [Bacteroidia bacterium]|nr:polysaccharide deacetylase family protein [Bacteroidia bacterium]